ncbi:MAG: Translational regulator CsrA [Candidatus Scalindua arabica]|uniref:Translational regulator CsrA n=1 Tax=Candidatus Scalindua arabica TaxID=1127984 RepID=A0A941ZZ58_9BACT|nr:Translational regulator CsrA [Candidatus Scalindua arabica]
MLILTRKLNESVVIGEDIITVLNINKCQIYLDVNISECVTINLKESVSIRENTSVTAVKIKEGQVKLGITAPDSVIIRREEVPEESE